MASKFALSVSLTEHLCAFIAAQVASGRYGTSSEVVRSALRMLEAETVLIPAVAGKPARKTKTVHATASGQTS